MTPDRAAELPFTEAEAERPEPGARSVPAEAGIRTGSDGLVSPSSQPVGLRGSSDLLPASTASGSVALPPLPRPMEREEAGYTTMTTCACGGRIRVERRHPDRSIKQHATTRRHRDWRTANGYDPKTGLQV